METSNKVVRAKAKTKQDYYNDGTDAYHKGLPMPTGTSWQQTAMASG